MPSTRRKPTKAGRYTWRLPESEKRGYYDLPVIIAKSAGELRVFSEGDEVATLQEAHGGTWTQGHINGYPEQISK